MQGPALTYLFLIIPTLFAIAVAGQGLYKMVKGEKDGPVAFGFGLTFLLLIGITYWFFIK